MLTEQIAVSPEVDQYAPRRMAASAAAKAKRLWLPYLRWQSPLASRSSRRFRDGRRFLPTAEWERADLVIYEVGHPGKLGLHTRELEPASFAGGLMIDLSGMRDAGCGMWW